MRKSTLPIVVLLCFAVSGGGTISLAEVGIVPNRYYDLDECQQFTTEANHAKQNSVAASTADRKVFWLKLNAFLESQACFYCTQYAEQVPRCNAEELID